MSDVEAELSAIEGGALLRELELGTITVRGPDRVSWLNGLATCDFAKRSAGDAAYGLFVQKNGKISSELYALLGPEDVLLGVRREKAGELVAALDHYLIMEDAEIALAEEPSRWFLALGEAAPRAAEIARAHGGRGGTFTRSGVRAAVFAVLPTDAERALGAIDAERPAIVRASDEGWHRARIARGIPDHGVDFDETNYPQEAALERDAVSFQKGCYLGQETVFMLEKRGHVKKRLVQLELEGPVAPGDPIATPEGAEVGRVTSVAGGLALGYVKYKQARAGTELRVKERVARVTPLLAIAPE